MPRRSFLAGCLGACLLWLGACGGTAPRPSVVLVLVDQLRADAADRWLSETRALAERGVRCTEMRSAAPWTYPSVISLLSGLNPQQHGANANQRGNELTTIDDAVPLLPRTLRDSGYFTAAFVTNPFLHESNKPVRAGFDAFDASFIGDQGMTRGHGEQVWSARMWSDSVNPAVRAYFDGRALGPPEFVYVHYIDVHGKKEGPERWSGAPFEPNYEAAVRHVDEKIHELYDYFRARYGEDLIFVVTSDHGQDSGDDLDIGDGQPLRQRKSSLHDFNLRIPFWILPGASVPSERVLGEPCTNVDVVPTLLEWLGLPPLAAAPGTSLLAALHGGAYDGAARGLYARNETGGRLEESLVHAHQKFMRYRDPRNGAVVARRLFDLAHDPREVTNLTLDSAPMETALDAAADPGALAFPALFSGPDEPLLDKLKGFGYGGEDDSK
jgi:arylsulfatase A-like enzyme